MREKKTTKHKQTSQNLKGSEREGECCVPSYRMLLALLKSTGKISQYLSAKKALVMFFIVIMPLLFREECLLGISVHSVVSREFSFLFFVPQCFLSCLFSPDVPFLVVSTDLPYLVPFFPRLPGDRDELPLSSARDPSIQSTEDNKNRVTMPIRSASIKSRRTN